MQLILAIAVTAAGCGRIGFDVGDPATIAFDATTSQSGVNTAALTWTHPISGPNAVLFVSISDRSFSGSPPQVESVTYDGAALGRVRALMPAGLDNLELWALPDAPEGARAIDVKLASSTVGVTAIAASYRGVAPTNPIDASMAIADANASSIVLGWNTIAPHTWTVAAAMDQGGYDMSLQPGIQTARQTNVVDDNAWEIQSLADQAIDVPGPVSFTWSTTTHNNIWIAVGASFIAAP